MTGFNAREIEVGGFRVGLLETGPETAPRALFAHCSLAFSGLWRGVMARLADHWRCISIDMPGHGVSDRGDEAISLQKQAVSYVEGVAAATGEGPAHLVGVSLGAAVMCRVAAKRPEMARSLTMIEPVLFHLVETDETGAMAENERLMRPVYDASAEGRYHDAARAFMEAWGQPGQFDRMPQPVRDAVARSLGYLSQDFDMVSGWPEGQITREQVAGIRTPTLMVQGERTHFSAKRVIDALSILLPHAERSEIAGAGHLSPVDDPEAVAARLSNFLESVGAKAASAV